MERLEFKTLVRFFFLAVSVVILSLFIDGKNILGGFLSGKTNTAHADTPGTGQQAGVHNHATTGGGAGSDGCGNAEGGGGSEGGGGGGSGEGSCGSEGGSCM